MPERRIVQPPKKVEPVEYMAEFTGLGEVKHYRCPVCGHSRQDKDQMKAHIANHGGEE